MIASIPRYTLKKTANRALADAAKKKVFTIANQQSTNKFTANNLRMFIQAEANKNI